MKEYLQRIGAYNAKRAIQKATAFERMKSLLLVECGPAIKDSLLYQKYELCRAWYVLKCEIFTSLFRLKKMYSEGKRLDEISASLKKPSHIVYNQLVNQGLKLLRKR